MKYNLTTSGHLRLQATDSNEAQRLHLMAQQAQQAGFPVGYDPDSHTLVLPIDHDGHPTPPMNPDATVDILDGNALVDCPEHGTRVPGVEVGEAGPYCRACLDDHLSEELPDAQPSTGQVRP